MNIPIWAGSSSFVSCSNPTPFAFYDTDAKFISDADKVADWCARRLGYPILEVELQDINFYAAFEESIATYTNKVNAFKVKDNFLSLQGFPTGSTNLSDRLATPGLNRLILLSRYYGTEAGVGGDVTLYKGSFDTVAGQQEYDINNWALSSSLSSSIEIRRMFHRETPAIVRYFDPFVGTGMGSQQMLDLFGWGAYSPAVTFLMMPIYADVLRLQQIEFNDQIRKSAFSFEIVNNQVRLFPIPKAVYKVFFDYMLSSEKNDPFRATSTRISGSLVPTSGLITDFSNVPYNQTTYTAINDIGRNWIFRYTLALSKEMLGLIRSKFATVPIPNQEVTLNGSDLMGQANTEKESLMTELNDTLEAMTRHSQFQAEQEISEAMQQQLSKVPLKIYVG